VRRLSRTCSPRRGPDRRTRRRPSTRWRRASAALPEAQGPVADQRRDALHTLTWGLTARFGTLVVEDLHARGMLSNHRLARHVADASFAEMRRQLEYKTACRGATVIVTDRWFASSKTCSQCGAVKATLALSEREWTCITCGTVLDRDINAAVNLPRLAGSGPHSNGRGANQKTRLARQVAAKPQPGRTVPAVRETGTAPTQDATAA